MSIPGEDGRRSLLARALDLVEDIQLAGQPDRPSKDVCHWARLKRIGFHLLVDTVDIFLTVLPAVAAAAIIVLAAWLWRRFVSSS